MNHTMVKRISKSKVRMIVILLVICMLVLSIEAAAGHSHGGYSHDQGISHTNTDWMDALPDEMTISSLSLPGTHDTMAYQLSEDCTLLGYKTNEMQTQSMGLNTQLHAGIRVLDIRAKYDYDADEDDEHEDRFKLHHGSCFLNTYFGTDVMIVVNRFLFEHPTETILMRVKQEKSEREDFRERFEEYMAVYGLKVWQGTSSNPTLGEVRGKIVILDDFTAADEDPYGLRWSSLNIQDEFSLSGIWDLYDKWSAVKTQLQDASAGNKQETYVNFLSGTSGFALDALSHAHPYRIASGHVDPATGGLQMATGLFDFPVTDYPDFPRIWCVPVGIGDASVDVCTIAYEGTNNLTTNYLNQYVPNNKQRVGIIMADFPGLGLIDNVIAMNPWNSPPVADAGGPYSANEGTAITLSASASYDPDGDPLAYRWDLNSDGFYDTLPSGVPETTYTWHDDWSGLATVEISDGYYTSERLASATGPFIGLGETPAFRESDLARQIASKRRDGEARRADFRARLAALGSAARPPDAYVSKGACPFECCSYGRWSVLEDTPLVKRPGSLDRVALARKGTHVEGVTGEVHTIPVPVGVVHAKPAYGPSASIPKGTIVFLLEPLGEGYAHVWHEGRTHEMETFEQVKEHCPHPNDTCWGEVLEAGALRREADWWVKVRLQDGLEGWTRDIHFGDIGGCG